MSRDKENEERIERTLGQAWRSQSTPEPSEAWHEQVMGAIAAEPGEPRVVPVVIQTRLAWRAACASAAAAVVVAAVGLWIMPSDAGLAWQLQRDGAGSEWVLLTGE